MVDQTGSNDQIEQRQDQNNHHELAHWKAVGMTTTKSPARMGNTISARAVASASFTPAMSRMRNVTAMRSTTDGAGTSPASRSICLFAQ